MKHLRAKAAKWSGKWAGIAALASSLSCVDMAPYRSLEVRAAGEDPDALYTATIRVLVHRGLGIMMADRGTREVRTRWFRFRDIGLVDGNAGTDYAGSFRVTFREDGIQVFTSCDWVNDFDRLSRFQACPEDQRPEGLHDREVELVGAILDEVRRAARVASANAKTVPPRPPPPADPTPAGCATDLDCKGDRVCADHDCVNAAPFNAALANATPVSATPVGAPPVSTPPPVSEATTSATPVSPPPPSVAPVDEPADAGKP